MKKKSSLFILGIGTLLFSSAVLSQIDLFDLSPGIEYIAVPGLAFYNEPGGAFSHYKYEIIGSTAGYVYPTGTDEFVLAPIYFPHPCKRVKKIIVQYYDNHDDARVGVSLWRKDLITNKLEFVGTVQSGFSFKSNSIQTMEKTVSGSITKIKNSRYSWFLQCYLDAGGFSSAYDETQLHQVIVKYTK